jgi:hypothetical protein
MAGKRVGLCDKVERRRRLRKRSEMPPRNDRCPDEDGEACCPKPEAIERKADEDVAAD